MRLSAWDWSGQFKQRQSLNGVAFVARVSPGDAAVIDWVRSNARPMMCSSRRPGCSYGEYYGVPMDRVSAYTGIPAVLGWQGHEERVAQGPVC